MTWLRKAIVFWSGCAGISLCGIILAGAGGEQPAVRTADSALVPPAVRVDQIDFAKDIRPILSQHCFACHGFDSESRAADLRLDIPDGGWQDLVSPGDPESSELFRRVTLPADSDERMPPLSAHTEVTTDQLELLRLWIEQGAVYADHWAWQAPQRPPVPESPLVADSSGARPTPLDHFLQQPWADRGLTPNPPADRYTLIRRVSLDLLGLPPTPEEIQSFVVDPDPQAYEKLVQRLLASPHLGERLALDWLDAARYADTNGYSIDGGRHQWLWRDWVIQAFNDNKPYDHFLREQLAGDLLPNPREADWIATGFQRNNMVTHEGGTIPEENLANYSADRVKTLGEAVLGLTLGCAQCHDHKYDPVTQKEYYQMAAFFNTLEERGLDGDGGVNPVPARAFRSVLKTDEQASLEARIAELKTQLSTIDRDLIERWAERERDELRERGRDFRSYPVEVLNVSTPNLGHGFEKVGVNEVAIRVPAGLSAFDMSTRLPELDQPVRGFRVRFIPSSDLPGGGWGRGVRTWNTAQGPLEKGSFVLTAVSATFDKVPGDQINLYKLEPWSRLSASSWDAAYPPRGIEDPRNETGWAPAADQAGEARFTVTLQRPIDTRREPYLTLQLNFGHGGSLIPGHFAIEVFTGVDDDWDLNPTVINLLEKNSDSWSDADWQILWDECRVTSAELATVRIELANLEERWRVLHEAFPAMIMQEAANPRPTHILARGDYTQPGEVVTPGVPAWLPPLPEGVPANRWALAEWLVSPQHPLTARVAVNRYWQLIFGRGLVATPADFGSQGTWPSHPELLDWLAVDFRENGWDVKRLLYQLVTSQAYRRSSAATPAQLELDPENIWLARGPRFRLSAEHIRDYALKVSGLWVPRLGGPSVNPYTPGDPWREVSHYGSTPATAQIFVQDHGEKLYRRSLYTYWKRTAPPPNLIAFDAPNREVCVLNRAATVTPLQALVLWNDVQFVEAARVLGQRMYLAAGTDAERLEWGFWQVLGRPATPRELETVRQALTRERERYQHDPAAAELYLNQGEAPRDPWVAPAELAAWGNIASVLLNLSETVTRH